MSTKYGTGKSLKGVTTNTYGTAVTIDVTSLFSSIQNSGGTLDGVTIQNSSIFGGMIDDMVIGSISPTFATVTDLKVGTSASGGTLTVYGNDGKVTWGPSSDTLNVDGNFAVNGTSVLGNLRVSGNAITATNAGGNVELSPDASGSGKTVINGNIVQGSSNPGSIVLNMAPTVTIKSSTGDATFGATAGNVLVESTRGTITLHGGSGGTVIPTGESLFFGGISGPSVTGSVAGLTIATPSGSLAITDPIPCCLTTSDFGMRSSSSAFFGRKRRDAFTFIPNAVVSANGDVSGDAGNAEFDCVCASTVTSVSPSQVDSLPGDSRRSLTLDANEELLLTAGSRVALVDSVDQPDGVLLENRSGGVTINANTQLRVGGDMLAQKSLYVGSEQNDLREDRNTGDLVLESGYSIVMQPKVSVTIHDDVRFQVGDDPGSYLMRSNPTGETTLRGGSVLALSATGSLEASSPSAIVNIPQICFPAATEISFANGSGISTAKPDDLTLISSATVTLSCPQLSIPPSSSVSLFSAGTISATDDNVVRYAYSRGAVVDAPVVTVNGDFTVNGKSTYVTSTNTSYTDSILSLGANSPASGDVKDRGFEFVWHDGPTEKRGFFGFDQDTKGFKMIKDGVNNAEVYSGLLGDLVVDAVGANEIVVPTINGTPDVDVVAENVNVRSANVRFADPSIFYVGDACAASLSDQRLSCSIPVCFGSVSMSGAEEGRVLLVSSSDAADAAAAKVAFDVPIALSDASLTFSEGTGTLEIDNRGLGGVEVKCDATFAGGLFLDQGSLTLNRNAMTIRSNGAGFCDVEFSDPSVLSGNVAWSGKTLSVDVGGTGSNGGWNDGSIMYYDSISRAFDEGEQGDLRYDRASRSLICTSIVAGTIRPANIALEDSATLWVGQNWWVKEVDGGMFTLSDVVMINADGRQIGIGYASEDDFVEDAKRCQPESGSLMLNRRVWMRDGGDVQWGAVNVRSSSSAEIAVDGGDLRVLNRLNVGDGDGDGSCLFSNRSGELDLSAASLLTLMSPHVLFSEGRCCLHHDVGTGRCVAGVAYAEGALWIENDDGPVGFRGGSPVIFADGCAVALENSGLIAGDGDGRVSVSGNDSLALTTQRADGVVAIDRAVEFGGTRCQRSSSAFVVSGDSPVSFLGCPALIAPNTVIFGNDATKTIVVADDELVVGCSGSIRMDAPNVVVTGNLVVNKKTTFTIESETSFDSGIIVLGGEQVFKILSVTEAGGDDQTALSLSDQHNLETGDRVSVMDTEGFDGDYVVAATPTPSSIVIALAYSTTLADKIGQGVVRSELTVDSGHDVGVQVNWNTGETNDTSSFRTGFFGFDRSSRRFTFVPEATEVNGVFSGLAGDLESNAIFCSSICASKNGSVAYECDVDFGRNVVTGGTFVDVAIRGDSSVEANTLKIDDALTVGFSTVVANLNAEMVGGRREPSFVLVDGTRPLQADWDVGEHGMKMKSCSVSSLASSSVFPTVVACDPHDGALRTVGGVTYDEATRALTIDKLVCNALMGDVDGNGATISNVVVVGSADFSSGNSTVTFSDGQIPGSKVSGGVAAVDISGTAARVVDGLYRSDFARENSMLKSDLVGNPEPLVVPENAVVGRPTGGKIGAISLDVVTSGCVLRSDYGQSECMLKADASGSPRSFQVLENSLVGRLGNASVASLSASDVKSIFGGSFVSTDELHALGAITQEGGVMTGVLIVSNERISAISGQAVVVLNVNVDTSYITATRGETDDVATFVLPDGTTDGQRKTVVFSKIDALAVARVMMNAKLVGEPDEPVSLVFVLSGQTAVMQWDNVLGAWCVVGGTGGEIVKDVDAASDPKTWYAQFLPTTTSSTAFL